MQFILMRTEQRIIRVISGKILKKILEKLSYKYNFNSVEALNRLNVEELLQNVCSLPKHMNDSADVSIKNDVSIKKRGRPCKVKGTREVYGDDLIASLIADVKMENSTPIVQVKSSSSKYLECDDYDDDDIEDEEIIEVKKPKDQIVIEQNVILKLQESFSKEEVEYYLNHGLTEKIEFLKEKILWLTEYSGRKIYADNDNNFFK